MWFMDMVGCDLSNERQLNGLQGRGLQEAMSMQEVSVEAVNVANPGFQQLVMASLGVVNPRYRP